MAADTSVSLARLWLRRVCRRLCRHLTPVMSLMFHRWVPVVFLAVNHASLRCFQSEYFLLLFCRSWPGSCSAVSRGSTTFSVCFFFCLTRVLMCDDVNRFSVIAIPRNQQEQTGMCVFGFFFLKATIRSLVLLTLSSRSFSVHHCKILNFLHNGVLCSHECTNSKV